MRSLIPTFAVVLSLACTSRQERPPAEVENRSVPEGPTVAAVPREPVTIKILAAAPGYSATEVEREIVVPIEQALADIPALAEISRQGGGTVRLDQLVHIGSALEPGAITRIDGHRAVVVEVRVGEDPATVSAALQRALEASLRLPPGYAVIWDPPRP